MLRASDTISRLGGVTVARVGGDKFVVLCEALETERDAIRIAERVIETLRAPFTLEGRHLNVTASVGIAMPDGLVGNADCLIRDADVAMYRAKEQGRNQYGALS